MRLTRVLYTNIINECQSPTCHGPATLCLQHLTVTRSTTCAKSRYWSKTNIFSYPTCIRRIRRGLSVGYWRKVWCGKLEWFVYLTLKMFEDMITRFHAILKRFRQQDRQTDTDIVRWYMPSLCIASRGKYTTILRPEALWTDKQLINVTEVWYICKGRNDTSKTANILCLLG